MENEIKIGEKYFIEVEVKSKHYSNNLVRVFDNVGVPYMYDIDVFKQIAIPHSKLMEVPEIGKEYEGKRTDGLDNCVGMYLGFLLECSNGHRYSVKDLTKVQQLAEIEELQQKAKELGYKLVKK